MDLDTDETPEDILPPPADLTEALDRLRSAGDPDRAEQIRARGRIGREVLGCELPLLSQLAGDWRSGLSLTARLDLARGLWDSDIYEARIMAAKLLTQARIRPDDSAVWELITSFVADFDHAGIADQVARAAERRLAADPARLDQLETWLGSENPWQRRAALLFTLPWTSLPHPKPADAEILARLMTWAERLVQDPDRLVQQALAQWLRELSRRNPEMTHDFLLAHGLKLPKFARKEAAQWLPAPVAYPAPEQPAADLAQDDAFEDDFDDEDEDEDEA